MNAFLIVFSIGPLRDPYNRDRKTGHALHVLKTVLYSHEAHVIRKFHELFLAPCKAPKIHRRYKKTIRNIIIGAPCKAPKRAHEICYMFIQFMICGLLLGGVQVPYFWYILVNGISGRAHMDNSRARSGEETPGKSANCRWAAIANFTSSFGLSRALLGALQGAQNTYAL